LEIKNNCLRPNCVQFNSEIWRNRLSNLGVPPTFTSVYHSQSNPAERAMRELGRLFRSYGSEHYSDRPTYVPYIEWVLNNTVHETTGSILAVIFLQQPRHKPLSALVEFPPKITKIGNEQEIQQSRAESRKRRHDRMGKSTSYVVGDLILVRIHRLSSSVDKCIHKLFMLYEGPFVINEVKNKNAYVVSDPKINRVQDCFNVVLSRPYQFPVNH